MRTSLFLLLLASAACGSASSTGADLATPDLATAAADLNTPAVPTYTGFAEAFIMSYCVSCHPSASSTRDFTQYAVVKQNAHNIACGVSPIALPGCSGNPAPGQFPIGSGPQPTDAERTKLVQWIQGGLPM